MDIVSLAWGALMVDFAFSLWKKWTLEALLTKLKNQNV